MGPKEFKKRIWLFLGGSAAYLCVLCLLTLAERNNPDASIRTVSDAFWYSLVTLSTVGYGDLYPVTIPGRLLGGVFILLSLGLLAFLFGLLVRAVTGRLLPGIRLWLARKKHWYVFSCHNDAAYTLAGNLAEQEPDCVLLFPVTADGFLPEQLPCLCYCGTPEDVAVRKKENCTILFLDEEHAYTRAVAALSAGHAVCCRTSFKPDACPENLTLFDDADCCARSYWQNYGLKREEQNVLLIGDGNEAETILERGLLLNVFQPERTVSYHVFGAWDHFLRNHHRLPEALCVNGDDPDMDRIHFHGTAWNADPGLLASADRIILCRSNREENLEILGQIRRYFPVNGTIHLLGHSPIPGETVFGTEETVFTPELVLQAELTRAARTVHSIYCRASEGGAPTWEDLSEFLRQSNIGAADHMLTKIRILLEDDRISRITRENCRAAFDRWQRCTPEQWDMFRRIEHRRWLRFHTMHNWRYAPVRNNALREHPLMMPYDALVPEDQMKDDYAWELLGQMAEQL